MLDLEGHIYKYLVRILKTTEFNEVILLFISYLPRIYNLYKNSNNSTIKSLITSAKNITTAKNLLLYILFNYLYYLFASTPYNLLINTTLLL